MESGQEIMIFRGGWRCAFLVSCALALAVPALSAFPAAAKIKAAFDAIDASHNGAVSRDEWDAASFALFRAADKNNDNQIDSDEINNTSIAPDTFLRADLNHDGKLSVSEFTELRRAIFQTADIDRDDFLSPVEYELLIVMEKVGWQDRNQNGRVDLSELSDSLAKAFDEIDTDHDGSLTTVESEYMRPAAFKRYDTNQDGKLTREEFVTGYRTELISG